MKPNFPLLKEFVTLPIALLTAPLLQEACAQNPLTTPVTYRCGNMTAVLQFEDGRLPILYPPNGYSGFYYGPTGRFGWVRTNPLDGRMYVSGTISGTDGWSANLSDGTINGSGQSGYLQMRDPSGGYQATINFDYSDNAFVYVDTFLLTANPFGDQPTYYRFVLAEQVATPVISPNGGNFSAPTQVTITSDTPDAIIIYTTDGSIPSPYSQSSQLYNGPFTLTVGATITAAAVKRAEDFSGVTQATFTVTAPPSLAISRSGANVVISWPVSAQGYTLQSATTLTSTNQWTTASGILTTNGQNCQLTTPATGNMKFFRLKK